MRIDLVPTIQEVRQEDLLHRTVIVIDVLRASSMITTALAKGCHAVRPVETIGQAKLLYHEGDTLMAGERYGKKIQGFDLHNSPTQLLEKPAIDSHTLILTTTNGTKAIHKASKADDVLIGCFLNATDCANTALSLQRDITILCAGSRGLFALEDGLAAGCIIERMLTVRPSLSVGDYGLAMRLAYRAAEDTLTDQLQRGATGQRLSQNGFEEDIRFCCQTDIYSFTPRVRNGNIILDLPS